MRRHQRGDHCITSLSVRVSNSDQTWLQEPRAEVLRRRASLYRVCLRDRVGGALACDYFREVVAAEAELSQLLRSSRYKMHSRAPEQSSSNRELTLSGTKFSRSAGYRRAGRVTQRGLVTRSDRIRQGTESRTHRGSPTRRARHPGPARGAVRHPLRTEFGRRFLHGLISQNNGVSKRENLGRFTQGRISFHLICVSALY